MDLQLTHTTMWCLTTVALSPVACIRRNIFLFLYEMKGLKAFEKIWISINIEWLDLLNINIKFFEQYNYVGKDNSWFLPFTDTFRIIVVTAIYRAALQLPIVTAAVNDRNERWRCRYPSKQQEKLEKSEFHLVSNIITLGKQLREVIAIKIKFLTFKKTNESTEIYHWGLNWCTSYICKSSCDVGEW